jgi:hypothetical protein
MRSETEIREELTGLIAFKKTVTRHFEAIELTKYKYALLGAFYTTIDHEIDLLRWILGEDIALWRDDMSKHTDIEQFFDSLPPTDFPWKQFPQSVRATARKAGVLELVGTHDE